MYQCLNKAIPSGKCSVKASPAKWRYSVYVLTEICHQRSKWLVPLWFSAFSWSLQWVYERQLQFPMRFLQMFWWRVCHNTWHVFCRNEWILSIDTHQICWQWILLVPKIMLGLGVKIRNMKVDFKTRGTWRQVGQWTLIMNFYDFFYLT